ncbi:MAG: OmpA family protein, partial [Myxococcota bacterium]
ARLTLAAHAGAIQAHPEWGVLTVEGHCDERGSYEYNLALGKSRAEVVKRFLIEQGVPASRLTTVSFGESKPITMGHDELAWRQNRRSELQPEARTASLRP